MKSTLQKKIEDLRAKFRGALTDRLGQASALISRVPDPGHDGVDDTRAAHRIVHELAGTAGFLGDATTASELRAALGVLEDAELGDREITVEESAKIQRHIRKSLEVRAEEPHSV